MTLLFRSDITVIIRNKEDEGTLELYEDHFIFMGKLCSLNGKVDQHYLKYEKNTIKQNTLFSKKELNILRITFSATQTLELCHLSQGKEDQLTGAIDQCLADHALQEKKAETSPGLPQQGTGSSPSQQQKAAEMRQRLQEAEKRRQQIEEENRRIAEEERRRKEEEERRRREEEERRRREEEERRRREEEERRRREEEERRRKEEEERRRREEAERKRLEKLRQREERIAAAAGKAREKKSDLSDRVTSGNEAAVRLFAENPLYILGLLSTSTKKEANDSLDKYKKLARLKSEKAFKPLCVLGGLPVPERNVSILQSALIELKNRNHYFLWFAGADAGDAWFEPEYHNEFLTDGIENATYDLFLANYLYAVVTDSEVRNGKLWGDILTFVAYMLNGKKQDYILAHLPQEADFIKREEVLNSFVQAFLMPLEAMIRNALPETLLRITAVIQKHGNNKAFEEFDKKLSSEVTAGFKRFAEELSKKIKAFNESKTKSPAELQELLEAGLQYNREISPSLELAKKTYEKSVRLEMIHDTHKSVMWDLMCVLNDNKRKEDALTIAQLIYEYCDDEDKRRVKRTFGFAAFKKIEQYPGSEEDRQGDDLLEGKNGKQKDEKAAVTQYQMAAQKGNPFAMNSLGLCYLNGKGVSKDLKMAVKYFKDAADKGNADAMFNLAWRYYNGEGVSKDKDKAFQLWLDAHKAGHPEALEVGKKMVDQLANEQKMHRLQQHAHYDLGYQLIGLNTVIVEVTLSHQANVYLLDSANYRNYLDMKNFTYYGGRATETPYRLKIPFSGSWHLAIDDGDNDMTFISTSVHTRTISTF